MKRCRASALFGNEPHLHLSGLRARYLGREKVITNLARDWDVKTTGRTLKVVRQNLSHVRFLHADVMHVLVGRYS